MLPNGAVQRLCREAGGLREWAAGQAQKLLLQSAIWQMAGGADSRRARDP